MARILIIGGGFAGLNAAKVFSGSKRVEVTIIDQKNHHLFQPLLYQVAAAALSPAEIAVPIRTIFSYHLAQSQEVGHERNIYSHWRKGW